MAGLILGNSHLAAVRQGWPQDRAPAEFWAINGGGGPNIRLRDGRVVPARPEVTVHSDIPGLGPDGFDPARYDYIALCSFGFSALRDAQAGHPLHKAALASLAPSGAGVPVSAAVLTALLADALPRLPGHVALVQLRRVYSGPILLVPAPLPALSLMHAGDPLRRIYGDNTPRFAAWYAACQRALVQALAARFDPPLIALDWPDPAWGAAGETPAEFADPDQDLWHMNAAYGARVADQLCRAQDIG